MNKAIYDYTLEQMNAKRLCHVKRIAYLSAAVDNCETCERFLDNDFRIFVVSLVYGTLEEIESLLRGLRRAIKRFYETRDRGVLDEECIAVGFEMRSKFSCVGRLENDTPILLHSGSHITLTTNKKMSFNGTQLHGVYVNFQVHLPKLPIDSYILIDRKIFLTVVEKSDTSIKCLVKIGGLLHSHADVIFPFSIQRGLTPEEEEDLKVILHENPDFILCRNVKDHRYYSKIKTAFYEENHTMKPIFCSPYSGLRREHFKRICKKFDGIWLDEPNEYVARKCRKLLKPIVMSLSKERDFIGECADAVLFTSDIFEDRKNLHFFQDAVTRKPSSEVLNIFKELAESLQKEIIVILKYNEEDLIKISQIRMNSVAFVPCSDTNLAKRLLFFYGLKPLLTEEINCGNNEWTINLLTRLNIITNTDNLMTLLLNPFSIA